MMHKKSKPLRGVTLIETILYLGIAVFVMGALFSYGWDIAGTRVKAAVIEQAVVAAQDVEQRIAYEIRRAKSVEDFSSSKLVLQEEDNLVTIEFGDGKITIKRGSDEAVAINSGDISIENLVFIRQKSDTDETQYVGFSFDAVANYPGSVIQQRYKYSLPVQSGASLRTY